MCTQSYSTSCCHCTAWHPPSVTTRMPWLKPYFVGAGWQSHSHSTMLLHRRTLCWNPCVLCSASFCIVGAPVYVLGYPNVVAHTVLRMQPWGKGSPKAPSGCTHVCMCACASVWCWLWVLLAVYVFGVKEGQCLAMTAVAVIMPVAMGLQSAAVCSTDCSIILHTWQVPLEGWCRSARFCCGAPHPGYVMMLHRLISHGFTRLPPANPPWTAVLPCCCVLAAVVLCSPAASVLQ